MLKARSAGWRPRFRRPARRSRSSTSRSCRRSTPTARRRSTNCRRSRPNWIMCARSHARPRTCCAGRAINAPVTGTVVRMYYHTSGGVIESGKSIMEILPADVPLIIEAQVPRTEIDNVKLGQNATVRLTALNQRTTPVLNGKVYYVSADSLPDASVGTRRRKSILRASTCRAVSWRACLASRRRRACLPRYSFRRRNGLLQLSHQADRRQHVQGVHGALSESSY